MWNTDILIYIYVYKLYRIKLILITIQLNLCMIFIPPPFFLAYCFAVGWSVGRSCKYCSLSVSFDPLICLIDMII